RRHTRLVSDWSSDVCSSDLPRSVPMQVAEMTWPLVRNVRLPDEFVRISDKNRTAAANYRGSRRRWFRRRSRGAAYREVLRGSCEDRKSVVEGERGGGGVGGR